jgi:hypothetical protein
MMWSVGHALLRIQSNKPITASSRLGRLWHHKDITASFSKDKPFLGRKKYKTEKECLCETV